MTTTCKCSAIKLTPTCKWKCEQQKKLTDALKKSVGGGGTGGVKFELMEALIARLDDLVTPSTIDFNGVLEVIEDFLELDEFELGLELSESLEQENFNLEGIAIRNAHIQSSLYHAMGNSSAALQALERANSIAKSRGAARLNQAL